MTHTTANGQSEQANEANANQTEGETVSNEGTPTASNAVVLIVGAGPVGCVLALELARHGIRSTVLERSTEPTKHPKMDYVNGRSMELLRRLGVTDRLRRRGVGGEHGSNFLWIADFDQPPVAAWQLPSPDQVAEKIASVNDGSAPVEPYLRVRGSLLEDELRAAVREHPLVDLREGWRYVELVNHAGGAVVTAERDGAHTDFRARYVVACDGANSAVRRQVGIKVDAPAPATKHRDVYFRSSDPTLRRHGRAFLTISAGGLTLVSRDEGDTWTGTFQVLENEPETDPVATVAAKLGAEFTVDEVINVVDWTGTLSVARNYRQGSVFLAGDSAHQFYPTGGHGANTGIADAVDLGWKLAATLHGWGGPALLDSYEAERRPVALFNREMCANLLEVWRRFHALVGYGFSREQIAGFLAPETYQVDNVGVHFGYRYVASPVVWHDDATPPPWHWHRITTATWPGARTPSVRLADGANLFDRLGTGYTLLDLTGRTLGEPAVKRAIARGMPISYLPIDDANARTVLGHDLVLIRPDQHVAWHGDDLPDDWDAVLTRVAGQTAQADTR